MVMCLDVDSCAEHSDSFQYGDSSSFVLIYIYMIFKILPFLGLSWLLVGPSGLILWFSHPFSPAIYAFVLLFYFLGESLNIKFQPSNDFLHFCYIFNFSEVFVLLTFSKIILYFVSAMKYLLFLKILIIAFLIKVLSIHFIITIFIKSTISQYLLWYFSLKNSSIHKSVDSYTSIDIWEKQWKADWQCSVSRWGFTGRQLGENLFNSLEVFSLGVVNYSQEKSSHLCLGSIYLDAFILKIEERKRIGLRSLFPYFILMSEDISSLLLMSSIWAPLMER